MKLILERSRTEQTLMKRIKAKQEQFKRLQEIDERKVHHGNIGLELRDSFVESNLNAT